MPNRERKLDLERQRICRGCSIEKQRLEAAAAAEAEDLPVLTGSAKQIAWAMTIELISKVVEIENARVKERAYPSSC